MAGTAYRTVFHPYPGRMSGPGPPSAARIWTGLGIVYFFWGTTYLAIDRPPPAERSPRCAGRRRAYRWVRWRRGARGWAGRGTRHRAGVDGRRRRVAIVGLWLALSAERADRRRSAAIERDAAARGWHRDLVGGAPRRPAGDLHPSEVSRGSALALLYLIVFGSLLTMSCYLWLLRVARTSLVSTYAYVNPVVAVFLGWLILDEPITAQVLGRRGGDPRERRPDRLGGRRGSRRTFRQGSAGEDRARVLLRGLRPPATTSARPAPERSVAIPPGAHPHRCRTGR